MSRNAVLSSRCAAWAQERERERRTFTDPIEIPAAEERGAAHREDEEDQAGDGGGAVLPPHELLARRRAASSVCSGQGRTLKGRDLRRVRDSVLRMTGFIES